MTTYRIPVGIREKLASFVFERADRHGYLEKGRVDNGIFMDELVSDPAIGVCLEEFMPKDRVKTYIKDAILNRYSKVRRAQAQPRDITGLLAPRFGDTFFDVEETTINGVSLHRNEKGHYIAVARTTYVKWETGIRRLLIYLASLPAKSAAREAIKVMAIFHNGSPINSAEKTATGIALGFAGIECVWADQTKTHG